MATRTGVVSDLGNGSVTITWEGITEADSGDGKGVGNLEAFTVQAVGDFTTSGAITMQGSNDGVNYGVVHDWTGADVVLTSPEPMAIAENPLYLRPTATAGTAVDMDVIVVGKYRQL